MNQPTFQEVQQSNACLVFFSIYWFSAHLLQLENRDDQRIYYFQQERDQILQFMRQNQFEQIPGLAVYLKRLKDIFPNLFSPKEKKRILSTHLNPMNIIFDQLEDIFEDVWISNPNFLLEIENIEELALKYPLDQTITSMFVEE